MEPHPPSFQGMWAWVATPPNGVPPGLGITYRDFLTHAKRCSSSIDGLGFEWDDVCQEGIRRLAQEWIGGSISEQTTSVPKRESLLSRFRTICVRYIIEVARRKGLERLAFQTHAEQLRADLNTPATDFHLDAIPLARGIVSRHGNDLDLRLFDRWVADPDPKKPKWPAIAAEFGWTVAQTKTRWSRLLKVIRAHWPQTNPEGEA